MSRLTSRVARMERLTGGPARASVPRHRLIVMPGEDSAKRIADMVAAGAASADDEFIILQIVDPVRR